MTDPDEIPVSGVRGLEHTADVGLEFEAPELTELFRRSALGAMWLVLERAPKAGLVPPAPMDRSPCHRTLALVEEDLPTLLRSWLRALLYWEETEGFVLKRVSLKILPAPLCSARDGTAFGLEAKVEGVVDEGPRVREIKGVTLHGLRAERRGDGWWGRVIFDV